MIMFVVFGTIIGVLLGTRFPVFALIPAMIGAVAIAAGSSLLLSSGAAITASELSCLLVFLQTGFLFASSFCRQVRIPDEQLVAIDRGNQYSATYDHDQV